MSDLVERLRDESWKQQSMMEIDEMEVWYKLDCEAADRIEALEGQLKNIKNVYDSIDLNACVIAPRKLFDLTDAIYADNKGKDQ